MRTATLRAFMAAHGYPDPATTVQERTIWSAAALTRTSGLYSTSLTRRMMQVIPQIRQAVHRVYATDLSLPPEWAEQQRQQYLDEEADKISEMVLSTAATMSQQAITLWHRTHPDQKLDSVTTEALSREAYLAAMRQVLSTELYELIPSLDENDLVTESEQPDPLIDRSQLSWQQRWTRPPYRSDPSEEIETLITRLWPDPQFSMVFRIKAGYLLAARDEDGLRLPAHPEDPLTGELAAMIYNDLRHDGLPAH